MVACQIIRCTPGTIDSTAATLGTASTVQVVSLLKYNYVHIYCCFVHFFEYQGLYILFFLAVLTNF